LFGKKPKWSFTIVNHPVAFARALNEVNRRPPSRCTESSAHRRRRARRHGRPTCVPITAAKPSENGDHRTQQGRIHNGCNNQEALRGRQQRANRYNRWADGLRSRS
jgi:hypothetical protein